MWTKIIEKLTTLLTETGKFQEIYPYEVEEFKGSPSCTITPSELSGDYQTNESNVRIYAYHVRLYVNRTVNSKVEADRIMRNLVDAVLDHLDKNYLMSGIDEPSGYTFINLFAVPSSWGYAGREDEYRAAEITVRCRVAVTLNQIT